MAKKSFFAERTAAQIRKLDLKPVHYAKGLVERVLELESDQALEVRSMILPGKFFAHSNGAGHAARKAYKHGDYLVLSQARTLGDALEETRLPHEIRKHDFDSKILGKKEQDINYMGYSFRPVQGTDKTKRLVPFAWLLEGARIFAYAMNHTPGIPVDPYVDAERVSVEGGKVFAKVPARGEKKERYNIRLESIPTIDNHAKHAISLGFTTTYAEGKVPEHSLWSFGYKFKDDVEQSNAVILYPHDFAAEMAVARHFLINEKNPVPWDMNPFAKPSQLTTNFYRMLCNNVVVRDPKISEKSKLRKLNYAEKSILIGRLIGLQGHDATMFWKGRRDSKLQDYDWSIPN